MSHCLHYLLVILFLYPTYGACIDRYYMAHPETSVGAVWCADENKGSCTGPGRVYFGGALSWYWTDVGAGQTIWCNKDSFGGCDAFIWEDDCYIDKYPTRMYTVFVDLFCSFKFSAAHRTQKSLTLCNLSIYVYSEL